MLKLFGTAAVTTDEADRTAIFDGSPEPEQAVDPDRLGTAFVVNLTLVTGFDHGEAIHQPAASPTASPTS